MIDLILDAFPISAHASNRFPRTGWIIVCQPDEGAAECCKLRLSQARSSISGCPQQYGLTPCHFWHIPKVITAPICECVALIEFPRRTCAVFPKNCRGLIPKLATAGRIREKKGSDALGEFDQPARVWLTWFTGQCVRFFQKPGDPSCVRSTQH